MDTTPTSPAQTRPHTHSAADVITPPVADQPLTDTLGVRVTVGALLRALIGSLALGVVMAAAIALLIGSPHAHAAASAMDGTGAQQPATSSAVQPVAFSIPLTGSAATPPPAGAALTGLGHSQEHGRCALAELDNDLARDSDDDQHGVIVQAGPLGVAVGVDSARQGECDRSDWSGHAESSSSHHSGKQCDQRARDCSGDCVCRDQGPNGAPSNWNGWAGPPAQRSTYPNNYSYSPGYGPGYAPGYGYGPAGYPNSNGPAGGYYGPGYPSYNAAPGYPPPAYPGRSGNCRYYNPGETNSLPRGGVVCTPTGR
jgi:hypothetical protein